jgi:cyclase
LGALHDRKPKAAEARLSFMVRLLVALVAGVSLSGAQCSRMPTEPPFTMKQIAPNAWAAIDNPKSPAPATSNAGFVIGDDGVTVIDTLGSVDAAKQLLAEIQRRTPLPVKFVINTHYHLDHVAGNGAFADAGATILAQRNVRDWIHTENLRLLGPNIPPELKALAESFVAPTALYDDGVNVYVGTGTIEVRSLPGHTGGDSIVVVPDSRVAFLGDLFWRAMLPNLIDASTQPWIDSLATILDGNAAGFTFVPGHGEVGDASDLAAFRNYLVTLRTLVADARTQGKSGEALAQTVVPRLKEQYGTWEFVEPLAKDSALQTEAEVRGTKRIPTQQRGG